MKMKTEAVLYEILISKKPTYYPIKTLFKKVFVVWFQEKMLIFFRVQVSLKMYQ